MKTQAKARLSRIFQQVKNCRYTVCDFSKPFAFDGTVYATDGTMLVRDKTGFPVDRYLDEDRRIPRLKETLDLFPKGPPVATVELPVLGIPHGRKESLVDSWIYVCERPSLWLGIWYVNVLLANDVQSVEVYTTKSPVYFTTDFFDGWLMPFYHMPQCQSVPSNMELTFRR